jgi:extracellular factor (EF) 3-hydroxypalmitic acid methyl ester biosynthesis protein
MKERVYTLWHSGEPDLVRWNRFIHVQAAPRAVRNRKELYQSCAGSKRHVLDMGCGPGRGVYDYLSEHRHTQLRIHCLDIDARAILYVISLCCGLLDCRNELTPECQDI